MRVKCALPLNTIKPLQGNVLAVYKLDDRRSTVWLEEYQSVTQVIKRFESLPLKQRFLAMLQIHPGQCEKRAHAKIKAMGLPVAVIQEMGWQHGKCYLTTPYIGPSLDIAIAKGDFELPVAKHKLARQLGKLTADLFKEQLFFRDLKISNILLSPEGELILIDAGSIRRVWQRSLPGCASRIFRLLNETAYRAFGTSPVCYVLSRTDRLRYATALLANLPDAISPAISASLGLTRK
ncbi:MAG: hypothetical protein JKX85_08065 [Phycisphaeraceae bacterium]|nr:hypothetical protein [Phycisphaeraceae bacterium]